MNRLSFSSLLVLGTIFWIPSGFALAQDQLQPSVILTTQHQWESPELRARTPVFVYLANDLDVTYQDDDRFQNTSRFISLLRDVKSSDLQEAEKQKVLLAADQMQADLKRFNQAVDEEIRTLTRYTVESQSPVGLAVFRNQGMVHITGDPAAPTTEWMSLEWRHYVPGSSGLRVEELSLTGGHNDEDWIELKKFQNQPLSLKRVYSRVLDGLGRVFPPDKYQYILFVKSRGHAMDYCEPYLPLEVDRLNPADVWQVVARCTEDFRQPSRSGVATLLNEAVSPFYPAQARLYSSTSESRPFFGPYSFLMELSNRHQPVEGKFVPLYFPVIVIEAGQSSLENDIGIKSTLDELGIQSLAGLNIDNVGYFYSFKRLDSYRYFDFGKFFVHVGARDPYFPGEVKRLLDAMVK